MRLVRITSPTLNAARWLAWLIVVAAPAPALAQARASRNIDATAVFETSLFLTAGVEVTFTTAGSAPGVDPVLRLWDLQNAREHGHDDNGGGGREARLRIAPTTTGWYLLVAHARTSASGGTTTIRRDGVDLATTAVGGFVAAVPAGDVEIETAFVPGGTSDTTLFGLDANDTVRVIDRTSGVGLGARLRRRNDLRSMIVSGPPFGPAAASVYVNDGDDGDGDGLGRLLEQAIGTCDRAADAGCAGVANLRDTDRDGLDDRAEVFGLDDARRPQLLPQWGADPRHKDIFIEVDFPPGETSLSMTPATFARIQSFYAAGPAADVRNPDGRDGIALHFDIGQSPTTAAEQTLFGAWGGAGPANTADYRIAPDDAANFAAIRRGVFHYAIVVNTTGGGQGQGDRFGVANDAVGFAHELGHNLGLAHHGHDRWGKPNCKPNYDSLMNYANYGRGFSTGLNPIVLNPAKVGEYDLWLADDPGTLPSYIAAWPFGFAHVLSLIDWNRDGVIGNDLLTGDGKVRAGITWAPWSGCAALVANATDLSRSGLTIEATPRLVRRGRRLYALFVNDRGELQYQHGEIGGPDGLGSCPRGDAWGTQCMTWSGAVRITTAHRVERFAAIEDGGEVAIAYTSGGEVRTLWAGAPGSDGALTRLSSETVVVARGAGPEVEIAVVPSAPEPNGTVGRRVAVFWSDGIYRWTITKGRDQAWSDQGAFTLTDGRSVAGKLGLAAVGWPVRGTDGEVPATACAAVAGMPVTLPLPATAPAKVVGGAGGGAMGTVGVATPASTGPAGEALGFYCLDATNARWVDRSTTFVPAGVRTQGRPGLAYHVFRGPDGRPVGTPARGQFVVTTSEYAGPDEHGQPRFWGNVGFSTGVAGGAALPADVRLFAIGNTRDEWSYVPAGAGTGVYEDSQISALKAVRTYRTEGSWTLEFLPFFDGTFNADLSDGNDFQIMERGACLSIRTAVGDAAFCGGPNAWGF